MALSLFALRDISLVVYIQHFSFDSLSISLVTVDFALVRPQSDSLVVYIQHFSFDSLSISLVTVDFALVRPQSD
jgi:hypothetical protein